MNAKKLRPCPFCGGEAQTGYNSILNRKAHYVGCWDCGAKVFDDIKNKAWDKWTNRQYTTDKCKEQLEIEEKAPMDRFDAENFLIEKGISNHPRICDSVTGKKSFDVADLIAECANSYFINALEPE